MTYKGMYDSATQYEQLDVVRYQSAAYLALADVIGEAPGTSAKWGLIAQDGIYSAEAGTGIELSGNTISVSATVINNLIAAYLQNITAQEISPQSTHNQIPTAKAVFDYAVSSAQWTAEYTNLIREINGKPSTADVQSMIDNSIGGVLSGEY